jgi:carbohydrate diacid regulator
MFLNSYHAQKIVEDMYHIANYNLLFTNDKGVIIASVDKSRIGDLHEAALEVLRTNQKIVARSSNQYKGAKEGVSYPILLNKKVVGVIGITGKEEDIGKIGEIVRRVAEMFVKELYMEKQIELEHVARQSFIQEWLLHRQDDEHAFMSRGYLLGIDVTLSRIVGVFEVRKSEQISLQEKAENAKNIMQNEELILQKLKNEMIRNMKKKLPNPELDLAAPISSSKCVMLFTTPEDMNETQAKEYIASSIQSLKNWLEVQLNCQIATGIGGYYEGIEGVKQSYIEGEKAVYFSGKQDGSPVIFYQDLRLERLVYDLPVTSRQDYIKGILKLETLPDPEQAIETLDCLFKCNHSINEVAARLHIHKNTVQYRLNKIRELTGFDPRHFEDAAALYLAVFLYSLEQKNSSI